MRTTTPLVDVGRALGASVLVAAAILTAPPPVLVQSAQSCVSTQGYWRSHPEAWPAGSLVLGTAANAAHTYNRADLIALMDLPTRRDASLTLADQLIAARLNVARGSSPAPIAQQLARADALFAVFQGRLPYGTAANTPIGTDMVAVARVLDDYNRGAIAGACTPGNRAPTANAGPDQSVTVGRTVTLDGSASLDPDGNPLTFRWVLVTKPADSAAALSDVTAVKPTFIADKRGQYEAQLVVRDGTADSAPDTVAISTVNSQPSAHAGPDQTLQVGSLAPLDGSASTDPDGDALTYSWAFVTKPASSNAALSDPAAVTPTFTVDRPGNYELELTVFDGHVASPVDRVAISTVNSPPEANAGTDTTAAVGDVVTLDGSGSSDRDGDPLTYAWALVSKPAGSLASLSDLAAVEPTIAIDRQGDYVMRLVVHDGTVASESDEVVISTINSRPDANAGADQPAVVGVLLALDGSGSTDVDGDALSYQWSITSRPAGSTANLTNPASVTPTFVPDVAGTYVAQLTVDDGSLNDSDTVTLTTGNRAPVANAGADQSVPLGATAQLDGTASFDPDGNALTYAWSLLTAPAGSVAALSNPASPTPTITTDIDGVYVLQLIVNDGALDSEPSTVTLSRNAKPVADAGANQEVETGATVLLDGRGSSDPDGTALGYSWSLLSRPASSGAALTGANSPTASFVADQDGTYVVQLIVSDGVQSSAPKTITITAASDADLAIAFVDPPAGTHTPGSSVNVNVRVANLGPLDTTSVSARFVLPAGLTRTTAVPSAGTYDVTSGVWTIGALDAGGEAVLQIEASVRNEGATALSAAITASDRRDPNPANDTATAGAINRPPTANAGADRQVTAGASALLDGSGSADPDGDVLAFEWRFTTRPATSTAALTGPTTAGPSFVADRAGLFVAELVVRDPSNAAATDSVSVTAAVNRPPLITSSPLTSGQAGAPYTYAVTAIDPDAGDTLTFSLPIAPAGMTIDSASGLVGWTPTGAQTGINQVAVHVRDRAGLLAAQGFSVEVGTGAGNGAPTAEDDAYDARTGESLSVSAPGVLANDRDPNGNRLRARALTQPANGTASVNTDGSFTYTPFTFQEGELVMADKVNLATNLAGVTVHASTFAIYGSNEVGRPESAIDGTAGTSWLTLGSDAANFGPRSRTGALPFIEVAFPQAVDVDELQVLGNRDAFLNRGPGFFENSTILAGEFQLFDESGAEIYNSGALDLTAAPHDGRVVVPDLFQRTRNAARTTPGVVYRASSVFEGDAAAKAFDGDVRTQWHSGFGAPMPQFLEVEFPADLAIQRVRIFGNRTTTSADFLSFVVEIFDVAGGVLFTSGTITVPADSSDTTVATGGVAGARRVRVTGTTLENPGGFGGISELEVISTETVATRLNGTVRRARFTDTRDTSFQVGISEFKVIGTTLMRREAVAEPNLTQLLPTAVVASSFAGALNPPENAIDDTTARNWYAASGGPGEFIELEFPRGVTVREIQSLNPSSRPDGFGTSLPIQCSGQFTLTDAEGAVLFDSGVVTTPRGSLNASEGMTIPVANASGTKRLRFTSAGCDAGLSFPAGFSEIRVIGHADVTRTPLDMRTKFQALLGREVHSTPLVANLTDDNGDGRIDTADVPDIVVAVETPQDQLSGEIKIVSGDDGRELATLGAPNQVSPWAEPAVGDLDGDGRPEVVAVYRAGGNPAVPSTQLIAFDAHGAVKWMSDANPMPQFALGSGIDVGAVAIANLDAAGSPEIVVGASVFSAEGRLMGDGRALGGTTGGTGLRSRIPAIADIDLDGVPELVAGPTAYRLSGGTLSIAWQRPDRLDGYVGIANLDDDPYAEVVIVANGFVYVLNHDGSDALFWNAPSNAPVPIPGGGQGGAPTIADLDGDGVPEIGVAGAGYYTVFDRQGRVRWKSVTSDRTSNATGATVFDLDGDGSVEVIYRDEVNLRIYRGADGVVLSKRPIGSSTWSESPVVADVDNDGHADLVVTSDTFIRDGLQQTGVYVLHDVANRWVRTRRIWNQHSYHVTNVNEDGSIPLVETPHFVSPELNSFRLNALVRDGSEDATDRFTYAASDGDLDSAPATVRLAVRKPNSGPRFTSTPIADAAGSVLYLYPARAADPDAGDILTFSLPSAPTGMTIDAASGLLRWTPTDAQRGSHEVVVKVHDVRGLYALQGYEVVVGDPIAVPNVVGTAQSAAGTAIAAATLAVGAISARHSPTVAVDVVLTQSPAAGTLVAPRTPVDLAVSLGPAPSGTVPDVVGQQKALAQVDIVAAGFTVGASTDVFNATSPAGLVLSQTPAAGTQAQTGSPIALVVSQGVPPGDRDTDGDGFTGNQGDCNDTDAAINPAAVDVPGDGRDQNCNGADSIAGDAVPPAASINSPSDLAEVTMPTDITGTATDANFLHYTLTLAEVDSPLETTIGNGTTAVTSGVLGRLDPTLLENGLYRIRLIVDDVNGHRSSVERIYRVTGEAKVGVVALSFVDLKVPVSGTPITVVRSYDSRVKRQGDFGVGWTLDVRRGAYRHNRKPGRGWIIKDQPFLGSFLPCIGGTSETLSHLTEVRLSDREAYTFALTVTNGNLGITGACEGEASFVFLDGPTPGATLEILDGTSVLYLRGGDDTLLDKNAFLDGTDQTYDPAKVRLTTIDGRRFDFDAGTGLSRIEDNNGNTLSITAAGILHSSGKSIAFTRDALGRITRIVGPGGQTLRYEYTSLGDLDAFVDQADNRTLFEYDTKHNLQQILDPLGNRAFRAEYDAAGRLIAMTDARGQRLEFAHDLGNREETITDARGTLTRLIYDDHGFVQSRQTPITSDGQSTLATTTIIHDRLGNERVVVDADGRRTESTFDFDRILESIEDPQGLALTTRYTYDGRGEVLTLTNPAGEVRAFEYDLRGNLTTATEASGTVTRFTSDDLGQLTRVVDALGVETRASYDGQGNLIAREQVSSGRLLSRTEHTYDANGNQLTESVFRTIGQALVPFTTVRSYDVRNRLVSTTNPLGQTARIEYNAIGLVSARIDEQGRRTTYEYDEVGALIRTEFPDGTSQTRSYDEVGNLVRETDEALRSTEFEYDELNRQVRRRLPDGSAVQYVYSPGGRLIAVIDPLGNRIDIKYDPAGRRITTSLPEVFDVATNQALRPAFREEWDEAGRVTARIDPQGRRTTREYDAAGRLLRTIYADGTSVEVRYDALGRLIGRIDEAGRLTTFERDGLGRVGAVVDALGGRSRYEYDEAGNLVREVDAKGRTTRLEYDALNRQAVKTLPGGQRDHFEYDEVGSVASYTDFNGQRTRFEYDARGRLLTKLYPDGSNVRFTFDPAGQRIAAEDSRGTTTYAYDVNRRLVGTRQPTGETVAYTYDAAGRVTQLISPAASVSYEYDALNRLSKVSTASGDTRYGYDSAGALVMTTAANGIVSRFDYDLRGRLLRLRHARGNSTLASFDYQLSATGRRVRMTEADGAVETYDYDALERLVREVRSGATPRAIGYDYDAVGNRTRMTRDGTTTTFSYDENDRLLTAGATAFAYDDNGQVVSRVGPAGASTMSWDFEGRMSRTVGTSGTTDFAYDADGNLVERVANGELTRLLPTSVNPTRYSQTIEERDATGNLQAQYVHGLDLLSMKRGGTESFYQYDALGSTRLLTDAAGLATDTYAFDGYGNLAATSGLTPNPYLFTGERLDESTGVYDLRARNYDPRIGRFMTRDPVPGFIEYPVSRHAYLYAHADPVNLTDPSGQSVLLDVMTALIGQEGLQTIQASIRAVKTCSIVGKVMAFAELGVFAACAFVVPEFIEAIYDVVGLQATSGSAKIGFVSSPPFFAEIEAKARTLKGVKKIEFRTFVDPPGAVVAVDSASGPRARVEGFYSPANGFQWGLSVGANIPIGRPLEACGVEVFKAEFAARAKLGGTGLNRPSPKAGVGLDLTLFKIIKSTVPIFPPDFFAF